MDNSPAEEKQPEAEPENPVRGNVWSTFSANDDNAEGLIALALYLRSEHARSTVLNTQTAPYQELYVDNETAFVYRRAAINILDLYLLKEEVAKKRLDMSTDSKFLLIKEEIRTSVSEIMTVIRSEVEEKVSIIIVNTSFSKQVIVSAVSGFLVGVFIVLASILPNVIDGLRQIVGKILQSLH